MVECTKCKKDFDRMELLLIGDVSKIEQKEGNGKLYCLECAQEPLASLFNNLQSRDLTRRPKKEKNEEEKYVPCGLCNKTWIPWNKCTIEESWVCDKCKETLKKIDIIRENKV